MIGIFDSGSGGLTVLRKIKEKVPNADIVYFGDIKNMPYGNRSKEELQALTEKAVKLLSQNGATQIVSACNSVSATVLHKISDGSFNSADIIEMSQPTVKKLHNTNGEIVVFGTSATIKAGVYKQAFLKSGKKINTFSIPELARAIEEGKSKENIYNIIDNGVKESLECKPSIAILGCTQFPIVREIFWEVFQKYDDKVSLYDPADAVAEAVFKQFNHVGNGKIKFILSKDSSVFRTLVSEIFKENQYEISII